jgi:hypothetical protein
MRNDAELELGDPRGSQGPGWNLAVPGGSRGRARARRFQVVPGAELELGGPRWSQGPSWSSAIPGGPGWSQVRWSPSPASASPGPVFGSPSQPSLYRVFLDVPDGG